MGFLATALSTDLFVSSPRIHVLDEAVCYCFFAGLRYHGHIGMHRSRSLYSAVFLERRLTFYEFKAN